MASEPNVQLVLNSRDDLFNKYGSVSNYQSTSYAAVGQNLVQGQIKKMSVNEVNFPYDIPNVQKGITDTISFFCSSYPPNPAYNGSRIIDFVIPADFYTGPELETYITTNLVNTYTAAGINALNVPTVNFITTTNQFFIFPPAAPTAPGYAEIILVSPYTFFGGADAPLGKDLLSIMGFSSSDGSFSIPDNQFVYGHLPINGGAATLSYTQYIDICSPELCQFQELKTGNTTNLSRRTDIICRLYISNNIAVDTAGAGSGTRPFVINRQYQNERMMRWTADNSIGNMTIQLYDDVGQPLKTSYAPRPYQITFNVYEQERSIR